MTLTNKPFHHVDIIVGEDPPSRPVASGDVRPAPGPAQGPHRVEVTHRFHHPVRTGIGFGFGFMAGRTLFRLGMVVIGYSILILIMLRLYRSVGF